MKGTYKMSETITLQNVGAIERVDIPLSEEGGVVIFRGRNGCGKSTGLDAIESLTSGHGKLPPLRDGQKTGLVSGFGSKIDLKLTGSRRGGKSELTVESIGGKFSIVDLVNPNIKEEKAADKARLKSLITLLGIEANADIFVELFDNKDEFDQVVSKSSIDTTDVILMEERIKRDIESKSRVEEDNARKAQAEYDAMTVGSEFDPNDIIADMSAYYKQLDDANQLLGKLTADRDACEKVMRNVDQAKRSILDTDVTAKENELASIRADLSIHEATSNERDARLERLNEEINAIVKANVEDSKIINAKIKTLNSIESELNSLEGYKKIVAQSETVKPVPESEIQAARNSVDSLRTKIDKSAIAKENQRKHNEAKAKRREVEALQLNAANLREKARRCDAILSDLIGEGSPLRIVDSRMVVNTERGETFYSELSDGERWRTAFETIAPHVHSDAEKIAVLTIPQVGWESLDPTNQRLVIELSKRYKINTVTAEAADGELCVVQVET
jgi:hypothetical protein